MFPGTFCLPAFSSFGGFYENPDSEGGPGPFQKTEDFPDYEILLHFKSGTTFRKIMVHLNDKSPKQKLNNVVFAIKYSKDFPDI